MNRYDITFIGTGPINLLNAYLILQKKPSLSILFVDSTDTIGGAWKYENSLKGYPIECGCHIWSYCPKVYEFIENDLNIELIQFKPIFIKGKVRIPYSLKGFIDSYKYVIKNTLFLKIKNLKKIKDSPNINLSLTRKNKYPLLGSQFLILKLYDELSKYPNIYFDLKKTVESIDVQDKITLTFNNNKIESNKVFFTSLSNINYIKTKVDTIKIEKRKTSYIHFLIELNQKPKKLIQYHRLMSDPIIHRITDISYQTQNKEHLILFGIKDSAYQSHNQKSIMDYITTYMTRNKIIDSTYRVKLLKEHIYPTYYIKNEQREIIKDLDPRVRLNHSTDLMHGMHKILANNV